MIPQDKWEWYGNVGHFICGKWCRFHLCTKVGEYLISTVGELIHPRHSGRSELTEAKWLEKNWPGEDIGFEFGRKYETMVFKAGAPCKVKNCTCGLPEIDGSELDTEGYKTAGEATKGHMAMCLKWS